MSPITLQLRNPRGAFAPRETLEGKASWGFSEPPQSIEVQLLWTTMGKGQADTQIADRMELVHPSRSGECEFRFTLPAAPYSVSGKLLSVRWFVRAAARPSEDQSQVEIVVSPTRQTIHLHAPGIEPPAIEQTELS